jgi:hypothetical protein
MAHGGRGFYFSGHLVGLGLVYFSGCPSLSLCVFDSIVPYYTPLVVSVKPRSHFISVYQLFKLNILVYYSSHRWP